MAFPNLTESYITENLQIAWEQSGGADLFNEAGTTHGKEPKCAAVLIPLLRFENEWHLLYTRRADRVETHKGQVSFPGGACDPGEETAEQTALREAEEEIGVRPQDVRVLGRLAPMVTITSFRVTPVVGVVGWPYAFRVEYAEVARVFTMPLAWLADKRNRWEFTLPGRKYGLIVYHPYDGELLWGATAIMTDTFMKVLGL
ncbi:MAG: CoA pyrophosphatase [Anaerolineales bacterium]|jgi:8-oxo-dGTP pyrophosphatase MutT (NUDIX family)